MQGVSKLFILLYLILFILLWGCEETDPSEAAIVLNAPSNLKISILNIDAISLTWIDNSEGETGFQIERRDTSGYTLITHISPDITKFIDTTAVYSRYNYYRIQGYHADSLSMAVEDSVTFVFLSTAWALVPAGPYRQKS